MVDRVEIRGIKSLAEVGVDLGRLTVLVGPNGCGKTTVLEEVARVCRMAQPGGWGESALGRFGVELAATDLKGRKRTDEEKVILWKIKDSSKIFDFHINLIENYLPSILIQMGEMIVHHARQANQARVEDFLLKRPAPRPLHLNLQPGAISLTAPIREEALALRGSGEGLPALLAHLAINEHDTYLAIQEDLRAVVPHFERLYLPQVRAEGGISYGLNLQMRGAGRIAAEAASEGTLLALGLLTAIHADGLADMVLVDDVDRGLHLGAQSRVLKAIRRVQERRPGLQVVMTTHSPYLLQEVEARDVRVMGLDAAGRTRVRRLDEHPRYERWRNGMGTGEFWANFGEDWVLDG